MDNIFSCFSTKTYVVDIETVILSTQKQMFELINKQQLQFYTQNISLSIPIYSNAPVTFLLHKSSEGAL